MPTAECLVHESAEPQIPELDITMRRGDDVVVVLKFKQRVGNVTTVIDWTGWTFTAEARETDLVATLMATATVTHNNTGGTVTILFPTADTSLLTPGTVGRWDLQGVDPGLLIRTVAQGDVLVTADVTV